jgi:hypothetical protein
MAVDKKIKYDNKPKMQGGVQNYLGKQPQVMAPRKWQSSPDKPATELAYITEAEKNLILKANIHGGLEGGPNMGPSGIMSLDSFGDADAGVSGGLGGGDVSDAETGRSFAGANTISNTYGRDLRAGAVAAGGRQGLNEPQSVLDQVKALQKQFGPRVGTNKFGGVLSGLLGLVNPAFGFLSKGLGFLGTKLGDLRGYNPDGTPRTQEQYEQAMRTKQLQGRLDKMYDRKTLGKNFSQINMDRLEAMGLAPSTAQNVLTGRDLKGFTDSRMGLETPELQSSISNYNDLDFVNEYGYPMTAGLLDNIGVRPTIGIKNTSLGPVPTGDVGLNTSGRLGNLSATVDAIDALKGESVNPELNYSGQFGNTNVYGNYSDDVQNLGLNFNNNRGLYGGVEYDAITGEPRANIGIRRTFAKGGLAGLL